MRLPLFLIATLTALAVTSAAGAADRSVFDARSPQLLKAVGQLSVPGHDRVDGRRRQRDENCSASLVAPDAILTAWHCLEYYSDLSRDPVFTLPHVPGQKPVAAYRVSDGGGMDADWAMLKLYRPIRSVKPLPVARFQAEAESLLLAGYARDEELGAGGARLTWQSDCRLLEGSRYGTDCVTYKGASGGPVMSGGRIVGVISEGDSTRRTFFAPSTLFFNRLRAFLPRAR